MHTTKLLRTLLTVSPFMWQSTFTMDTIISIDEVTILLASLPSLANVPPDFKNIWVLLWHFEQALECLPCPQSTLHGWKGMVMAQELYAFITPNLFRLPNDPRSNAVYVRPINLNNPGVVPDPAILLTRKEQATIDTTFTLCKNYLWKTNPGSGKIIFVCRSKYFVFYTNNC